MSKLSQFYKILSISFIVSCTNSNLPFVGTNKKSAEQAQAPTRLPNQSTNQPNTPYNPPAKPNDFKPLPTALPAPVRPPIYPVPPSSEIIPTSTPAPPITPAPTPSNSPSATPSNSPQCDNGFVMWTTQIVVNQDTGNHHSDGQRLEVTSQSGELLASGIVDEFSLINGESASGEGLGLTEGDPIGGSPFVWRTRTKYMSANAASLTGTQQVGFRVFVPSDNNAPYNSKATAKDVANSGHSNGISTIPNATGTAQFQNGNILVKSINGAGTYGSCPGSEGIPCSAGAHPSRMYAFKRAGKVGRDPGSPLVIDFSSDQKLTLTSIDDRKLPVRFDLKDIGVKARAGWVGKATGLLAIDLNGDGKITSGRELFGEFSHRLDGTKKKFDNGFIALSQYDLNNKGYIDATDPVFDKLLVWFDVNHNGISDSGELKKVSELGIEKIDLHYEILNKPLKIAGNLIPLKAKVTMKDGRQKNIYDVYFQMDHRRSLAEIQKSFIEDAKRGSL